MSVQTTAATIAHRQLPDATVANRPTVTICCSASCGRALIPANAAPLSLCLSHCLPLSRGSAGQHGACDGRQLPFKPCLPECCITATTDALPAGNRTRCAVVCG